MSNSKDLAQQVRSAWANVREPPSLDEWLAKLEQRLAALEARVDALEVRKR